MKILQIGCHEGKDHVNDFIRENEDDVNLFMAIDASYKSLEKAEKEYSFLEHKFISIHCAVSDFCGFINFFSPVDDECSEHNSIYKNHLLAHSHKKIKRSVVPTSTLNNLNSLEFGPFDRIYIDTEGADIPILLNFDLDYFRPKYIEFELAHSDGPFTHGGEKYNELAKKLIDHNYVLSQPRDQQNITAEIK